jgi:hypothetical protein
VLTKEFWQVGLSFFAVFDVAKTQPTQPPKLLLSRFQALLLEDVA